MSHLSGGNRPLTRCPNQLWGGGKEIVSFTTILLAVIAAGLLAAYEGLFDPTASAEAKRWGQTILTAILSGGLSFVLARMNPKHPPESPSPTTRPPLDSTDAPQKESYPQPRPLIPWTQLTRTLDSPDATRTYPLDSTDETNS